MIIFCGGGDGNGDFLGGECGRGLVAQMKGDFTKCTTEGGGGCAGGAEDGEFVREDGMLRDVDVGPVRGDEVGCHRVGAL